MLSSRQCYSLGLIVLVITSSIIPGIEAGRYKSSGSRKTGGGSSSSKKRPQQQPSNPSRTANPSNVALSYPSYNQQPARPVAAAVPKAPSAPAAPAQNAGGWNTNAAAPPAAPPNANVNSRPIGWNVNNNNAAAPQQAGVQKATATQNNNAPPAYSPYPQQPGAGGYNPPPYSAGHPNGPPPAYGQQPAYGGHGAPPPAYTPNGHGYPQQQQPHYNPAQGAPAGGAYGQPHYNPQGGYPQQQGGGFGGGGGYPMQQGGGFGGGYGGHQPVINNYYGQKSGGGMGLTNALLLGVGGIALYGALKPGETKVIYVNNSTNPEDARQVSTNGTHVLVSDNSTTVATPLAPFPDHCGQYMNQPIPPQQQQALFNTADVNNTPAPLAPFPEAAAAAVTQAVPLAEVPTTVQENNGNSTDVMETTTAVPLATEAAPAAAPAVPVAPEAAPAAPVPAVPLIPQECLPFVTGQVLPTNYTGPPVTGAAFAQQPNPNIQYGNPQWQQNYNPALQQQVGQGNTVPEGVQQKANGGGMVVSSVLMLVASLMGSRFFVM